VLIREERAADHDQVREVHSRAFGDHGVNVVRASAGGPSAKPDDRTRISLVACEGDTWSGTCCSRAASWMRPPALVDVAVLSPLGASPA
jgi:putative acetyltransferase